MCFVEKRFTAYCLQIFHAINRTYQILQKEDNKHLSSQDIAHIREVINTLPPKNINQKPLDKTLSEMSQGIEAYHKDSWNITGVWCSLFYVYYAYHNLLLQGVDKEGLEEYLKIWKYFTETLGLQSNLYKNPIEYKLYWNLFCQEDIENCRQIQELTKQKLYLTKNDNLNRLTKRFLSTLKDIYGGSQSYLKLIKDATALIREYDLHLLEYLNKE